MFNLGVMNKMRVFTILNCIIFFCTIIISGCRLFGGDKGDNGELIGAPDRQGWEMTRPFGMVSIPSGTFHMGQADEDVAATQINFNKQVTIGAFFMDDTEITNNEYRQFTQNIQESSEIDLPTGYSIADLMPDTTVWTRDYTHHLGDPLVAYYWSHPAFDDYPVVGIDWNAAKYFSEWRTRYLNDYRTSVGLPVMPNFRLPSEAEWEYASRGGRDMAKYPWGNPYIRNAKGCLLANFKPGRGNYFDDGYAYTSPIGTYFANEYGLFDMSGNVAEWCEDAYNPSAMPLTWDLNPTYFDENVPLKVIRGGSWKDIAYFLETGTRSYEHQDTARSSIGFRCAMTYLGGYSGNKF
ncbi:MAG: SUMF1/EgtB/PvdO family nonheme iron enzyme [Ekhidna sp.]|nr:SUMF1/EgtB/PvdO family nonheme iron enzyme [Ekhidna sp.]MBC6409225.1 SUMF1/EgtB/PvdO family nonheme iron enzyme [Ekhidna sp.]MBC6424992.1 SUMF1/EgtB/PvdO family nonheme iron enzyme [Ekhidna sp.]